MRCPESCGIVVIFGPAFLPLPLPAGGTHSTATFLRSVATAWAFFGTSRSPRMMARSALPSASAWALAGALSVCIGRKRTELCAKAVRHHRDELEVMAVGGPDRDPQRHRPHRKIVSACKRADDGENSR